VLISAGSAQHGFVPMFSGLVRSEWTSHEYEITPPIDLLPDFKIVASAAKPAKQGTAKNDPVLRYSAIEYAGFEVFY